MQGDHSQSLGYVEKEDKLMYNVRLWLVKVCSKSLGRPRTINHYQPLTSLLWCHCVDIIMSSNLTSTLRWLSVPLPIFPARPDALAKEHEALVAGVGSCISKSSPTQFNYTICMLSETTTTNSYKREERTMKESIVIPDGLISIKRWCRYQYRSCCLQ